MPDFYSMLYEIFWAEHETGIYPLLDKIEFIIICAAVFAFIIGILCCFKFLLNRFKIDFKFRDKDDDEKISDL